MRLSPVALTLRLNFVSTCLLPRPLGPALFTQGRIPLGAAPSVRHWTTSRARMSEAGTDAAVLPAELQREFKTKQVIGEESFASGVGIGVFVTSKMHPGAVLMGKRIGSAGAGTWALPGGHLEFGESFEACAAREVEEECGIKVSDLRVTTVTNALGPEKRYHYVVVFLICETLQEPVNMEPNKCEGWEWKEWESAEFPSPLFLALDQVRAAGHDPFVHRVK
ncbi:NUDIX hydrolase domain-like protein [Baffinella frigidus]|nr:NUDIX hydrolase domain-like protein [Cryptophyta sp. CCMP2293]|mmetsp:Transcript_70655/g.167558  ORF Transcript_70655/g.167558 Transcript_70655/m.167558 type:complete len:222 (+) Transcript_70655:58-723(+)